MKTLLKFSLLALVSLALANATAVAQSTPAAPAAKATATVATPKTAAAQVRRYDRRLDEIRERGELVVGTAPFVPWAFNDPKVGWLGFDVDVARQLAADLGVTLKIVEVPFPRLLEAVRNGDVDIATGVSITPQRALLVAFSQPYSQSHVQLIVRKQDAGRADWNSAGVVIGARAGTVSESAAAAHFPLAEVMPFARDAPMFAALDSGKIGALLASAPQGMIRMAIKPDTVVIAQASGLADTAEGFAVRKGEPSLVNFLNAWIVYWRADGWLEARRHDWFDSLDWTRRLSQP
ncbi:MAG: transporter substrate-binding domain-containing protein [Proteobacteria bacterium]|nr:transporter substrate-binding domain-containing protein [Pseudomonadota bacterium]